MLSSPNVIWPNFSSFLVFCYFHLGTILVILEIETRTLSYKEKVWSEFMFWIWKNNINLNYPVHCHGLSNKLIWPYVRCVHKGFLERSVFVRDVTLFTTVILIKTILSDPSTEIKDSMEGLQFPHPVGGKEATWTPWRNERLQACRQWPCRSLFICSGITGKVSLHSCLESSCAQAASEHNWLCCSHRRMWWLFVTLWAVLSLEWTAAAMWS